MSKGLCDNCANANNCILRNRLPVYFCEEHELQRVGNLDESKDTSKPFQMGTQNSYSMGFDSSQSQRPISSY